MAILTKFAWGPISTALDKREAGIADNIAKAQGAADEARKDVGRLREETRLAQPMRFVPSWKKLVVMLKRTKQQILADAKAAAKQEHDRAIHEVQIARDGALKDLAEKGADLATELAGKMLRAQMSKADHSRLVQETVTQFVSKN